MYDATSLLLPQTNFEFYSCHIKILILNTLKNPTNLTHSKENFRNVIALLKQNVLLLLQQYALDIILKASKKCVLSKSSMYK